MTVTEYFEKTKEPHVIYHDMVYNDKKDLAKDYFYFEKSLPEVHIATRKAKPEITRDSLIEILEEEDYETDSSSADEFLDITDEQLAEMNRIFHDSINTFYEEGEELEIDEEFLSGIGKKKREKYKPYDSPSIRMINEVVIRKRDEKKMAIDGYARLGDKLLYILFRGDAHNYTPEEMLEGFTWANGKPFGQEDME
jgi:hypothetical protein